MTTPNDPHCSFCDKTNKQVHAMVAAGDNTAFICDECIVESTRLIFQSSTASRSTTIGGKRR